MAAKSYRSWAHTPPKEQSAVRPAWRNFSWPSDMDAENGGDGDTYLAYGNGRSYGDSCLNSAGVLIDARSLNKVISFNVDSGTICCEAGLLISDLLALIVPKGWFVPVTPGTSYVTLGGALANDVHGKNHHRDGCLGNHIRRFELLCSDGHVYECSPEQNSDLYQASIGGLGLTGFVRSITLQLMPIESSELDVETVAFNGLQAFLELSSASEATHQYVVAWLDCMAGGKKFGRGILLRANHSKSKGAAKNVLSYQAEQTLSVPFHLPAWCLSRFTVRCFNELYFWFKANVAPRHSRQSLRSYFYPLDAIGNWNRIYGKQGFYQCQLVVPKEAAGEMERILEAIVASGQSSFLAVLKEFGSITSPGLMSFPRPGLCLALDFPDRGAATLTLLAEIEQQVIAAGGALYPAKDRSMSADGFRCFFPELDHFRKFVDPAINSDFWSRVNG